MKRVAISAEIGNAADYRILCGILKFINEKVKWEIRLFGYPERITREFIISASKNGFDGLIAHVGSNARLFDMLQDINLPLSIIDCNPNKPPRNSKPTAIINIKNNRIGKTGAKFLDSLGHFRSYAFAGAVTPQSWSDDRKAGFVEYLRSRNIRPCILGSSDLSTSIRELPKPAAIMAAWDMKAVEILQTARAAGFQVPDDISILGVDADPFIGNSITPSLTSVDPDFDRLGYAAAAALDAIFCGRKRGRIIKVFCPPKGITVRKSTRYVPPTESLLSRAKELIALNAVHGLTVSDLAFQLGVSIPLLTLRFRQVEKTTPGEMIIQTKLAKVRKSLLYTSESLTNIAASCGFNSVNRLSHLFKERNSMSMREYRKRSQRTKGLVNS